MTDFQLTQLAVALGTLTTILVGLYRESRSRKWDLEDRQHRMDDAAVELKRSKAEVLEKVETVAQQATDEAARTRDAIKANTKLTTETKAVAQQALETVNGTNEKLGELQKDLANVKNGQSNPVTDDKKH